MRSFRETPVRWTVTAGALLGGGIALIGLSGIGLFGSAVGGGLLGLIAGAIIDS